MRTEARIKTRIWDDENFAAQEAMSKLVYFTILSQPRLNLCGVIPYTPLAWSGDIGISKSAVHKGALALQEGDFITIDEAAEELWVRTLTKNDGILDKPFLVISMTKEFVTIKSRTIRGRFLDSLGPKFILSLPERFPKAYDSDKFILNDGFVTAFNDRFGR